MVLRSIWALELSLRSLAMIVAVKAVAALTASVRCFSEL